VKSGPEIQASLRTLAAKWGDYTGSPDHKPAWLKDVFFDPEAKGTSG